MARDLHCAGCGKQLIIMKMALPSKAKVISLVNPHECEVDAMATEEVVFEPDPGIPPTYDEEANPEKKKSVNELFDSFDFVKKLNKEEEEKKVVFDERDPGDRRGKEHQREEILQTSTAPDNIVRNVPGVAMRRDMKLGDDPRTIVIEE